MGLFSFLASVFKGALGIASEVMDVAEDANAIQQIQELIDKFQGLKGDIEQILVAAESANERYNNLTSEQLFNVPAYTMYNELLAVSGDPIIVCNQDLIECDAQIAALEIELAQAEMALATPGDTYEFNPAPYEAAGSAISTKENAISDGVETFLHEDTSIVDAAKLWDAKWIKQFHEHMTMHLPKDAMPQDMIMSQVMEAFRNWESFARTAIDTFGSQNIINATYEAVLYGLNAMDYMSTILDLNMLSGGDYHILAEQENEYEYIDIPNPGFFGGGFFI